MVSKHEQGELKAYIFALFAAWDKSCDTPQLMAYTLGLRSLTLMDIKRGIERAIETERFLPSVGELRKLCGVVTPADRAVIAWNDFSSAMIAEGSTSSVEFDDTLIHATVWNLGGWEAMWDVPSKEFSSFFRARFEKTYIAYANNGASEEMQRRLIGSHERRNAGIKNWKETTGWKVKKISCDSLLKIGVGEKRLKIASKPTQANNTLIN